MKSTETRSRRCGRLSTASPADAAVAASRSPFAWKRRTSSWPGRCVRATEPSSFERRRTISTSPSPTRHASRPVSAASASAVHGRPNAFFMAVDAAQPCIGTVFPALPNRLLRHDDRGPCLRIPARGIQPRQGAAGERDPLRCPLASPARERQAARDLGELRSRRYRRVRPSICSGSDGARSPRKRSCASCGEDANAPALVDSRPGNHRDLGLNVSAGPAAPFRATGLGTAGSALVPLPWTSRVQAIRVSRPIDLRKPE